MPILRPNALRSLQSALRHSGARATARVAAPARTQLVAKRFASSGGHGAHESSSDIPWAIGAFVVTPPCLWYLWPEPHDDHHEAHGHGEHGHEEHGGDEEEKPSEEGEQSSDDEEAAPAEKSDDTDKDSEKESKEGEDDSKSSDSKDEEKDSSEEKKSSDKGSTKSGSTGKGPMKEESDGNADERKSEPRPSKGSNVKRIDSGLGKNLGSGQTYDEEDPKKETQATSKDTGSSAGDISNKQKGLSTTDTRHSTQIDENPEKSKKGSGEPETAKAKGTVDPNAPAR